MNGGLENGAAPPTNDVSRVWDHAWTNSEMRKSATNWTLASDAGMLQHMQEFSQRLLSHTHEMQEQVDSLVHEAKLTNVRLDNVFNDFIMLANTQFMENRVYDEEVGSQENKDGEKKPEEKEKTKEQREAELIPKISQAISLGLNVFDTAYETLDMNVANSDSEDDDPAARNTGVIFEPKDPYIHRPLPVLIGSKAFHNDDTLGLKVYLSEKEENDIDIEVEVKPSRPEVSEVKVTTRPASDAQRPFADDTSESDSGDDLFGERRPRERSDSVDAIAENSDSSDTSLPKSAVPDFNSELAARVGASSTNHGADASANHGADTSSNQEAPPQVKSTKKKKVPTATLR